MTSWAKFSPTRPCCDACVGCYSAYPVLEVTISGLTDMASSSPPCNGCDCFNRTFWLSATWKGYEGFNSGYPCQWNYQLDAGDYCYGSYLGYGTYIWATIETNDGTPQLVVNIGLGATTQDPFSPYERYSAAKWHKDLDEDCRRDCTAFNLSGFTLDYNHLCDSGDLSVVAHKQSELVPPEDLCTACDDCGKKPEEIQLDITGFTGDYAQYNGTTILEPLAHGFNCEYVFGGTQLYLGSSGGGNPPPHYIFLYYAGVGLFLTCQNTVTLPIDCTGLDMDLTLTGCPQGQTPTVHIAAINNNGGIAGDDLTTLAQLDLDELAGLGF